MERAVSVTLGTKVVGVLLAICCALPAYAADVYLRFRLTEPRSGKFKVTTGGHIHKVPWRLPSEKVEVEGGVWSDWIDLTRLPLHDRVSLVGGLAEWPTLSLTVSAASGDRVRGCTFQGQLADKPDTKNVVISFTEKSAADTIKFLVPHPLRERKAEFETGTQMASRHLVWARKASGGHSPRLRKLDVITALWEEPDPAIGRQTAETLRLLGFNVAMNLPEAMLREIEMRTYSTTWHLNADPEESEKAWWAADGAKIAAELATEDGRGRSEDLLAHYVICDEIMPFDFRPVDPAERNAWFREYLREQGETDASLGKPIDTVDYPAAAMYEKSLPRDADLSTRKINYYAGKFGQYWTVKQLKQTSELVKGSFSSLARGMRTETLPSDHNYFNAWGAPFCGMGYRGLDLFEIGAQQAVDIISAEDWMGYNHMYGPEYTWLGAQGLEFLSAIYRSGIRDGKGELRTLITPSDDRYLRLKAYSALAQGSKSLYFWTFGPTYVGTENYWSDLRSEYDGIARVTRALEKSEEILASARPVSDKVAILYSVSHDIWHTDDPAGLVETRLTWAALRHLSIQPDILREEDGAAGRLKDYRVLYLIGQCISRKASAAIDAWVRAGGTVFLAAGAATRDEFYDSYVPPFAGRVWPPNASSRMIKETGQRYNERSDLPTIKPLTKATPVGLPKSASMPVIGYRLDLNDDVESGAVLARFGDGKPAGVRVRCGKGTVYAFGFLPGLAYSPFKVGQTTLDEVWPAAPRALLSLPLAALPDSSRVVRTSEPVVEASLLTGPAGSALVLVNYTYKPIGKLRVSLPGIHPITDARSTEGVGVKTKRTAEGLELQLPLAWTDIVVLPRKT